MAANARLAIIGALIVVLVLGGLPDKALAQPAPTDTATNTAVPPTDTAVPPTNTAAAPTETATFAPTATDTATAAPTETATATATDTPSALPTDTLTPSATATQTVSGTLTATSSPTASATATALSTISAGCAAVQAAATSQVSRFVFFDRAFIAGDVVSVTASEPSRNNPVTVQIRVNGSVVASAPFPGTVSYIVPTTGVIDELFLQVNTGFATLDPACTASVPSPTPTGTPPTPDAGATQTADAVLTATETAAQGRVSEGCAEVAATPTDLYAFAIFERLSFTAGEVLSVTASEPSTFSPTIVEIVVNNTRVASTPFPGTVSYTIPTTRVIRELSMGVGPGNATIDLDCTPTLPAQTAVAEATQTGVAARTATIAAQPTASQGCGAVAAFPTRLIPGAVARNASWKAGEVISITASEPSTFAPTTVRIFVDGVLVASTAFPGTVSYTIPTTGVIGELIFDVDRGTATIDLDCRAVPPTATNTPTPTETATFTPTLTPSETATGTATETPPTTSATTTPSPSPTEVVLTLEQNPLIFTVPQGQQLVVPPPGLLGNVHNPSNVPLFVSLSGAPSNGQITQFGEDGSFSYLPNAGFTGEDSFTYIVSDQAASAEVAALQIEGAAATEGTVLLQVVAGETETVVAIISPTGPAGGPSELPDTGSAPASDGGLGLAAAIAIALLLAVAGFLSWRRAERQLR